MNVMPNLDPEQLAACQAKNLVFTVTTGRSGSGYLQGLMATVDGVTSLHEASPDFAHVMRFAQSDRRFAYHFLAAQKFPAIVNCGSPVYFESSHLFCKGFLEPMLAFGVIPNLIVLRRTPRKVALSLLQLATVPARTWPGMQYLVCPDDMGVLPLPGWQRLSDYQLCYWYCLEIERRARLYTPLIRSLGGTVVETSLDNLSSRKNFFAMLERLKISFDPQVVTPRYIGVKGSTYNAKTDRKVDVNFTDEQLALQEAEVEKRVRDFDPALVDVC